MRSVESPYHKDSNMFRSLIKVKLCSAGIIIGWVTKYEYHVFNIRTFLFPPTFSRRY